MYPKKEPGSRYEQFVGAFGTDTYYRIVDAAEQLASIDGMEINSDAIKAFGPGLDATLNWALSRVMRHGDLSVAGFRKEHGIAPNYGEFLVWVTAPDRRIWLGDFNYQQFEQEVWNEGDEDQFDDTGSWSLDDDEGSDDDDDDDDDEVVALDIPRWMPHG